jgi:hypothetical protein
MLQHISTTFASPRLGARLIGATKCKNSFHQLPVHRYREFEEDSFYTRLKKLLQSLVDENHTITYRLSPSPHAPSPRTSSASTASTTIFAKITIYRVFHRI